MSNRHGARWPFVSRGHYNRDMDELNEEIEEERDRSAALERAYEANQADLEDEVDYRQHRARIRQRELRQAYQAGGRRGLQVGAARGQQQGYRYGLEDGYDRALDQVEEAEGYNGAYAGGYSGYGGRTTGGYGYGGASPGYGGRRHGGLNEGYGYGYGYGGHATGGYGYGRRRDPYDDEYDPPGRNDGLRNVGGRPSDYLFTTHIPGDNRGPQRAARSGRTPTRPSTAGHGGTLQAQMPGDSAQWHGRADTVIDDD